MVQTYLEKICDEHQVDWKPKVPLKAEDISNPMSAPSGYSVQVGGGSGINAKNLWKEVYLLMEEVEEHRHRHYHLHHTGICL